jgi:hypothetical protein
MPQNSGRRAQTSNDRLGSNSEELAMSIWLPGCTQLRTFGCAPSRLLKKLGR